MENSNDRYVLIGLSASGLLIAFYIIVASLLGGIAFALGNFVSLWYWMIPLIVGFGIQIGLFFYVKNEMHKKATAQAVTSAGISSASMVACCAHHIADIAPFLGITALGIFLTKYQSTLLLIGILSNFLGIIYMWSIVNTRIPKFQLRILFYSLLIFSIIAVGISYFLISKSEVAPSKQTSFQTQLNNQNNVEFQVTPLSPSKFEIAINTHSIQLDFDLTQISKLYDNLGNEYKPLNWDGSDPEGHHRSGTLAFEPVDKNAKSITLIITDSAKREFKWDLK